MIKRLGFTFYSKAIKCIDPIMSKRVLNTSNDLDSPPQKKQRWSIAKPSTQTKSQHGHDHDEKDELQDIDVIPKIVFVSGNPFKVKEVKSFFNENSKSINYSHLITNEKLDLQEIQGTPKEIITAKLFEAKKYVDNNTSLLVHDTSIVLNAFTKTNRNITSIDINTSDNYSNKSDKFQNSNSNSNCNSNTNTNTNTKSNSNSTNIVNSSNDDDDGNSFSNTKDIDSEEWNDEFLGFPGPFIKYLIEWDNDGTEALCKMVRGLKDNSCYALAIYGFLKHDSNVPRFFTGKCHGYIPNKPINGEYGFAWDNVFIPKGQKNGEMRSFAQMPLKEKMQYSQNLEALKKFKQYLDGCYFEQQK